MLLLLLFTTVIVLLCLFQCPRRVLAMLFMKVFGLDSVIICNAKNMDGLSYSLRVRSTHLRGYVAENGDRYGYFCGFRPFFLARWEEDNRVVVVGESSYVLGKLSKMTTPLSRVRTGMQYKDGHIDIKRLFSNSSPYFDHDSITYFDVTRMDTDSARFGSQEKALLAAEEYIRKTCDVCTLFIYGNASTGKTRFADILASDLNGIVTDISSVSSDIAAAIGVAYKDAKPSKQAPIVIRVDDFERAAVDESFMGFWAKVLDVTRQGHLPHLVLVLIDNSSDKVPAGLKVDLQFRLY